MFSKGHEKRSQTWNNPGEELHLESGHEESNYMDLSWYKIWQMF